MSFLEQLEKKAQEQRREEEIVAMAQEEKEFFFAEVAEPTMRELFDYLKKLIDHLNYLGDERYLYYNAPGYDQVRAQINGDLRVRFAAPDQRREIDIAGTATLPLQPPIDLFGAAECQRMRNFCRDHGFSPGEKLRRNGAGAVIAGTYRLSGTINVRVLISCTVENPEITMDFTNFFDFGRAKRVVAPEQMNTDLMDLLGRFIARVDDDFLREDISEEIRASIRSKLRTDRSRAVREQAQVESEARQQDEEKAQASKIAQKLSGRFKMRLDETRRKFTDN